MLSKLKKKYIFSVLDVAIGEYNADVSELQEAAKKQLAQRGGIFSEKASFFKSVNGESKIHYT